MNAKMNVEFHDMYDAQRYADNAGIPCCVVARNSRGGVAGWMVVSDEDATKHVNNCLSPWSHWSNHNGAGSK